MSVAAFTGAHCGPSGFGPLRSFGEAERSGGGYASYTAGEIISRGAKEAMVPLVVDELLDRAPGKIKEELMCVDQERQLCADVQPLNPVNLYALGFIEMLRYGIPHQRIGHYWALRLLLGFRNHFRACEPPVLSELLFCAQHRRARDFFSSVKGTC